MNTKRLFTISKTLHNEVTTIKLVGTINSLVTNLEQAINTPNEDTQRAVENLLKKLYESLEAVDSNNFSPGIRAELEGLKVNGQRAVSELIGLGLSQQLRIIFEGGYTSVQTLDQLRQLATDITALTNALHQVNNGVGALGMEDEELSPGQSVVGIMFPSQATDSTLRELQREIKYFAQFLVELTEVVEGTADEHKVYSLHTSGVGIDVLTSIAVAANFAAIVAGMKAAFDMIRDFKKLKENAEKLGVGEKLVNELTSESKAKMEVKIEEIHAEVFQNCKVSDKGRVNELKTGIKIRLNGLANRIDRGFSFEVRTALPEEASEEEQKHIKVVNSFGSVRFERLEGSRLLELPENEEEEQGTGRGAEPRKKKQKPGGKGEE